MTLSILSYNCKVSRNSCDYLKDIMADQNPAFVCLQETWHLSNTASVFTSVSDQYMFFETSGVELVGRMEDWQFNLSGLLLTKSDGLNVQIRQYVL